MDIQVKVVSGERGVRLEDVSGLGKHSWLRRIVMTGPGGGDIHTRVMMIPLLVTTTFISRVVTGMNALGNWDLILILNGVQPIFKWFTLVKLFHFPQVCWRQPTSWKVDFLKVRRFHAISAEVRRGIWFSFHFEVKVCVKIYWNILFVLFSFIVIHDTKHPQ